VLEYALERMPEAKTEVVVPEVVVDAKEVEVAAIIKH